MSEAKVRPGPGVNEFFAKWTLTLLVVEPHGTGSLAHAVATSWFIAVVICTITLSQIWELGEWANCTDCQRYEKVKTAIRGHWGGKPTFQDSPQSTNGPFGGSTPAQNERPGNDGLSDCVKTAGRRAG